MRRAAIAVPVLAVLVALLALRPGAVAPGAAQEATPAAGEVLDPELCRVEPRPLAYFEQFLATPGASPAAPPAGSPAAATAPAAPGEGEPADAATVAAVTETAREVLACLNARDQRRAAALFTDAYFERLFARSGRLPPEELGAFAATPVPAPPSAWTRFIAVREARVLADGRVGAVVVTDNPAAPPPGPEAAYLVFAEEDGRWLIDEPIVTLGPAGTPAAG